MKQCGRKCCGIGQRKTARRLFLESGSIIEFLKRISKHDVKEGDLTYTLIDKSTIIAEHNKCFCKNFSLVHYQCKLILLNICLTLSILLFGRRGWKADLMLVT